MGSPHSADNIQQRQGRLSALLADSDLDAILLNAGPSQSYFTGLHFHLSERPYLVILTANADPTFVLTSMEIGKVDALGYEHQVFTFGEDPAMWVKAFEEAANALGDGIRTIGVEFTQLRLLELRLLEKAFPNVKFEDGAEVIAEMRQHKDAEEIAAMQRAAEIAEDALLATLPMVKIGVSEKAIAGELMQQLREKGSDAELPFFPIVASGPNSANPHSTISDRKLATGDLVIIDWGASVDGYFSDITRTFAMGELDEELTRIHQTVEMANRAGRAATKPGVSCEAVDVVTRDVIEDVGYGEFFIHRTGHGLGMESHEPPYIRVGNKVKLEEGMTFTIEPGIYLAGRGGVRIEDDVVVTKDGVHSFSLSRGSI
jgi:Xaa-Pro dipeptidase